MKRPLLTIGFILLAAGIAHAWSYDQRAPQSAPCETVSAAITELGHLRACSGEPTRWTDDAFFYLCKGQIVGKGPLAVNTLFRIPVCDQPDKLLAAQDRWKKVAWISLVGLTALTVGLVIAGVFLQLRVAKLERLIKE